MPITRTTRRIVASAEVTDDLLIDVDVKEPLTVEEARELAAEISDTAELAAGYIAEKENAR